MNGEKRIHWELCKRITFYYADEWYLCKTEAVIENEMHEILWDFEIHTDVHIQAKRPNHVSIKKKKKTCQLVDFTISTNHIVKMKENEKLNKYLDLARELKKLWNMKVMVIPVVIGALGTIRQKLEKRL